MIKEPKYRSGIDPLDSKAVFIIVAINKEENNGDLIITEGLHARWMGMTKDSLMKEIDDLIKEIDDATTKLIQEKKERIKTTKKHQDSVIDLEARYSNAFVGSVEELSDKISEREEKLAKEEQDNIVKTRRKETEYHMETTDEDLEEETT